MQTTTAESGNTQAATVEGDPCNPARLLAFTEYKSGVHLADCFRRIVGSTIYRRATLQRAADTAYAGGDVFDTVRGLNGDKTARYGDKCGLMGLVP